MTGRLRWWYCSSVCSYTAGTLQLNYTPLTGETLFFWHKWTERSGKPCLCSVLSLRQENWMFIFFICITGFIKCLKIDIRICLWWTGKKLVTLLAARIRLQDCSRIKAIDFSWRSWTSFGEGGQQVLHEKRDGVRQDVCTNSIDIWEECKEQQIK